MEHAPSLAVARLSLGLSVWRAPRLSSSPARREAVGETPSALGPRTSWNREDVDAISRWARVQPVPPPGLEVDISVLTCGREHDPSIAEDVRKLRIEHGTKARWPEDRQVVATIRVTNDARGRRAQDDPTTDLHPAHESSGGDVGRASPRRGPTGVALVPACPIGPAHAAAHIRARLRLSAAADRRRMFNNMAHLPHCTVASPLG